MNFNAQVYALIRRIPPGKVLTYGRVAALLEVARGARAVGWALRRLPDDSDVPWQRVINAAGRISTRYVEHGELVQRALLEAEGVRFDDQDCVKLHGPDGVLWKPSPWEIRDLIDPDAARDTD
jgi:methylated-DNA-protein-cysteine methyltransferase-like protein